jgi:hypothetical protein
MQTVDPTWLPIPNAEVTVTREEFPKDTMKQATESEGYARFWLTREDRKRTDTIQVKSRYCKEAVAKGVHSPEASFHLPTAYVQFRLEVDPRGAVTVNEIQVEQCRVAGVSFLAAGR